MGSVWFQCGHEGCEHRGKFVCATCVESGEVLKLAPEGNETVCNFCGETVAGDDRKRHQQVNCASSPCRRAFGDEHNERFLMWRLAAHRRAGVPAVFLPAKVRDVMTVGDLANYESYLDCDAGDGDGSWAPKWDDAPPMTVVPAAHWHLSASRCGLLTRGLTAFKQAAKGAGEEEKLLKALAKLRLKGDRPDFVPALRSTGARPGYGFRPARAVGLPVRDLPGV